MLEKQASKKNLLESTRSQMDLAAAQVTANKFLIQVIQISYPTARTLPRITQCHG